MNRSRKRRSKRRRRRQRIPFNLITRSSSIKPKEAKQKSGYLKKLMTLIGSFGVRANKSADRYLGLLAFSAQCMISDQVL